MYSSYESLSRAELLFSGMTRRGLAAAVSGGSLIRARRDRYVWAGAPEEIVRAVRVGGRVTCLSLLRMLGVFVFADTGLHVHVARGASRLRAAHDRFTPLPPRKARDARLHWITLVRPHDGTNACVGVVDALIHAVLCQEPRHAVATIDSAVHRGLVSVLELGEVFTALPRRFAVLRGLVDGRAESGPETLVRLMARTLGYDVDVQVEVAGVGRVDLLLDGWLIIECDSKGFHASWEQQRKDRERDLAAARLGYATFRPTAEQIMYRPDEVVEALRALRAVHDCCRVSR